MNLDALPIRHGHFLLESGLHASMWIDLDVLFVDPQKIEPDIAALAMLIESHGVTAICGPLLGGAFVAQALAARLGRHFFYTEHAPLSDEANSRGLFRAVYQLPKGQRRQVAGERVAVVDDVISAGSSVRATVAELEGAGASVPVVGALLLLGNTAAEHFSKHPIPVVSSATHDFEMWEPAQCPHCKAGMPLQNPSFSLDTPDP